ncbi:hypothetical protein SAMN05878482_10524 [Peribacillus simplex]|uniref:Uncharacterized protein n=1 Tax=Peribacillus simplex TaxID=1478 RepID=A0A9X8RAW8_9BACI|nr:hypothetical protein [Peribacillus simplex]SIR68424.1 hypothetical protein SAMN05878482_10524 [Peribacillus simplex]
MKLMSILSGKGFVMYNKDLAHSVSVNGAIIFGQLCSSYESFGSKGMLTIREDKEYFFLTSETLEKETSLTYKQQLKAAKELEVAGYIATKVMGVPSKKYFHITDKIVEELLLESNPKYEKREDLNIPPNQELERQNVNPSYDKRENLALTKGAGKPLQKGSSIKKKNKKEQDKEKKDYIVNKETVNNDDIIYKLTNEYRIKGLSIEVCVRVVEEARQKKDIENFGAYLRTCLENTLYRSNVKHGVIDPHEKFKERLKDSDVPLYNWLEDDNDELPY